MTTDKNVYTLNRTELIAVSEIVRYVSDLGEVDPDIAEEYKSELKTLITFLKVQSNTPWH